MAPSPPRPPHIRRAFKVSLEQLGGVAALGAVITAGAVDDGREVLLTLGRVAAIYFFLMLAFRLLGKRELSSLSPLELITLMLIPEIARARSRMTAPCSPRSSASASCSASSSSCRC